ncbi:MAG: hypothetical protein U0903_18110 [Planctomycetales bacterium]
MKMPGVVPEGGYRRGVELTRPNGDVFHFTIKPLGLGFSRMLRGHGIMPPARPTRVARDSAGKPVRDAQGLAVLVADPSDSGYQVAVELYHQRMAALMIAEAIEGDPSVAFEVKRPEGEASWETYADELVKELEKSGWSAGDVAKLCHEIAQLSRLLPEHLAEQERSFFPGRGADER